MTGFRGAAFVTPVFSLGGYYGQTDKSGQQSVSNQFSYTMTGIEAGYHFPSATGDTFVALRIGMTKITTNQNNIELIFSPYHYGFGTGYDYFVFKSLSIGFEGSYLHVQPGRTADATDVSHNMDSFNVINFLIALKFHL
jgi:hypothetical protein